MKQRSTSITRHLIAATLLIELLAGVVLIVTVGNHERQVQFEALNANLRATASALLGGVQEADTSAGQVELDLSGIFLPGRAKYSVVDEKGNVLGAQGEPPVMHAPAETFVRTRIDGRAFRLFTLDGVRIIDPGTEHEVDHRITVVFGLPEGHVWEEVWEEVRFFSVATLALLGATAMILTWVIRRSLLPIHELARAAEEITADNWAFHPPANSMRFAELAPLGNAMQRTLARLQRSFDQQRRFTSDAAHELKTDVAIIKSSLQLTAMKPRTVEEHNQALNVSLEDIRRLEGTIGKMLVLARLEQASVQADRACDFADAVQDAVAQSRSMAELKGVEIETTSLAVQCRIAMSREDAVLLSSNILINAIQYSPPGGKVLLSLERLNASVRFTVRDSGPGVAEQDLEHLFEPFYRSDASRSRGTGGTGLGLSICKAICDRLGGSIGLSNAAEAGAVVTVVLPVAGQNAGFSGV